MGHHPCLEDSDKRTNEWGVGFATHRVPSLTACTLSTRTELITVRRKRVCVGSYVRIRTSWIRPDAGVERLRFLSKTGVEQAGLVSFRGAPSMRASEEG